MNNCKDERQGMPEWLMKSENYEPQSDKDTFVNKSILSLLQVISRIKAQDMGGSTKHKINVNLNVVLTFVIAVLLSLSRSFLFVVIINVYLLVILSTMKASQIIRILRISIGAAFFTFIVMLPAVFWGNSFSSIMITSKAFATITLVSMLSNSARWGSITSALKRFFIPDIFILVLDIAIKYIVMLGGLMLNMLYALKLRSVGKNRNKYTSLSGIAGTMFIKSKEMAEDMYSAMECRGFTGEYHVYSKSKFTAADYLYILVNAGIAVMFFYFERK